MSVGVGSICRSPAAPRGWLVVVVDRAAPGAVVGCLVHSASHQVGRAGLYNVGDLRPVEGLDEAARRAILGAAGLPVE